MLNKLKSHLSALSFPAGIKPSWLLSGLGGVLLTGATVFSLWHSSQNYVALYGAREHIPVAQVVDVLGSERIPYRINPDNGQILVVESKLPEARMVLAAKGIAAILPEGYELMDKEQMLGSSQFVQNIRYKRSLEGELMRSIMALDAVEQARVHLGLSEPSAFVLTDQPQSSASVVVQLRYGRQLNDQQVAAIVQLVAGSVPGMPAENVRVVDQAGRLLSEGIRDENNSLAGLRQSNYIVQGVKTEITQNIDRLLTSLVGAGNFRISVAPDIDLTRSEETQERLGKEPLVSEESLSQENTTNELAIGIPGSLSNRPASTSSKTLSGSAENAEKGGEPQALSSRNQQQRKFVFNRDIRHLQHPGYKIQKIHVAVAVNQAAPALKNMTAPQFDAMTRLLEEAAGIDKGRGDSLMVDKLTFTPTPKPDMPALKWWQDPDIRYWAQYGGTGVLALILLLILRPLINRFTRKDEVSDNAAVSAVEEMPDGMKTNQVDALTPLQQSTFTEHEPLPPQGSGLETKVGYLQKLVRNETERVADVLKQWINSNESGNSHQEQQGQRQ